MYPFRLVSGLNGAIVQSRGEFNYLTHICGNYRIEKKRKNPPLTQNCVAMSDERKKERNKNPERPVAVQIAHTASEAGWPEVSSPRIAET
jgi:hypothetical protein